MKIQAKCPKCEGKTVEVTDIEFSEASILLFLKCGHIMQHAPAMVVRTE